MRKHFIATGIAVVLALTLVTLPAAVAQETQQEAETETVNGSLKSVDLEQQTIVVAREDETEVTLKINENTEVHGPQGEPQMLSALVSHEGATLTAEFVQENDQNVAVTIRLVAN